MFRSVQNSGFQMVFQNGYTISVQYGPLNYCEKRSSDYFGPVKPAEGGMLRWESKDAEIAIWSSDKVWYEFEDGQEVKGWCSPDEVAEWISKVSKW